MSRRVLIPRWWLPAVCSAVVSLAASPALPASPDAERGKQAMLDVALEPSWPAESYETAWKVWGLKEKPADHDAQFRRRYGLHVAPYENGGLPMGLKYIDRFGKKFIANDCLMCHGGSFDGQGHIGMPNAQLDYQLLYDEMYQAAGVKPFPTPFELCRTRGTVNCNGAGTFVLLLRDDELNLRLPLGAPDWAKIPDMDIRSFWQWRRKNTLYTDGAISGESSRSMMVALAASPFVSADKVKAAEPEWENIREYLRTLTPPKYPFEIDARLASTGQAVFEQNCAHCHGTYGESGEYPNKIVPIDEIGTDRGHFDSLTADGLEKWNKTWFGRRHPTKATGGYQAPPLDGVWATAPYFHNGSAPTVAAVLNSKDRPPRFRNSLTTNAEHYDQQRLGWKCEVLSERPGDDEADLPAHERRRIYDTSAFGQSKTGHPFGDDLSADERREVIEYLKTL